MSDLISRSELLKAFNNKNVQITFDLPVEEVLGEDVDLDDFAMLVQDAIQAYKKMVIDTIKNQPTAYDIDKVVEELEEMKMRYFLTIANTGDEKSDFAYENVGNALDKAIEIVKQGDVSDDVCEWKQDNMCEKVYIVCGGCFTSAYQKDFKFCPYCGKKIKVVE